ncbi:MAG: helix-turn-helix domain-containing protein [Chloroflexia bacterium]|nr:helix-turn-helix domain-containing protein [Chloroflexia bacterium]
MVAKVQKSVSTQYKQDVPPTATYSLRDLAGLLNISYTTMQELAQQGQLPVTAIRIGRQYRFPIATVHALLDIQNTDSP